MRNHKLEGFFLPFAKSTGDIFKKRGRITAGKKRVTIIKRSGKGYEMRLDKFLKVSRIIKRRTLAKEVCDQGRVQVNGRVAKAGTEVSVGDQLTIQFGQKVVTVEVAKLSENVRKDEASTMFKLIKEERLDSGSNVLSRGFCP